MCTPGHKGLFKKYVHIKTYGNKRQTYSLKCIMMYNASYDKTKVIDGIMN